MFDDFGVGRVHTSITSKGEFGSLAHVLAADAADRGCSCIKQYFVLMSSGWHGGVQQMLRQSGEGSEAPGERNGMAGGWWRPA